MSGGNDYRTKAAEFLAQARTETNPARLIELQNLARAYLRLAEMADRNDRADIVYEPPDVPMRSESPAPPTDVMPKDPESNA